MTFVVPFDGSDLSGAALARAGAFGRVLDEPVCAVSVIPVDNRDYARERGWLEPDENFDLQSIVSRLHEQVTARCPSADFNHSVVDRYAPQGSISLRLRRIAKDVDASMVFIGSENAGRLVSSMSSVGSGIAADDAYDVVIIRHPGPSKVATLRDR
ncbi:universal stress protein [Halovivax gelatinilyticus]|uniref:universal stress protein n=1 Tax=Halovivax gelatinilyticus TaxID=2961597 RepID=UPI0020CA336E|nr:universal stress protein [Halovivax gelatinilyticus]